jgi:hypothetical protein
MAYLCVMEFGSKPELLQGLNVGGVDAQYNLNCLKKTEILQDPLSDTSLSAKRKSLRIPCLFRSDGETLFTFLRTPSFPCHDREISSRQNGS